jgi:hypothetical protein
MALAARFSARQGRIPPAAAERLIAVMNKLGLPVEAPRMAPERWLEYMGRDKKNREGRVTLILLDALGAASIVKDTAVGRDRRLSGGRLARRARLFEAPKEDRSSPSAACLSPLTFGGRDAGAIGIDRFRGLARFRRAPSREASTPPNNPRPGPPPRASARTARAASPARRYCMPEAEAQERAVLAGSEEGLEAFQGIVRHRARQGGGMNHGIIEFLPRCPRLPRSKKR